MSDATEFKGVPNTKIVNGKKVFNCTLCGECCHIRERDKNISAEDEEKYRQYMFSKFGIIYLARLADITINVWPEEAEAMKKEAEERKIKLNIVPKRAIYDKKAHEIIILDYFIDHDVCPFFNKNTRLCTAYGSRPIICRSYPLLSEKTLGKCEYKLNDIDAYAEEKTEAKKLDIMVRAQKSFIENLVRTGKIVVPEQITNVEMDDILRTARFKELRIMDKVFNTEK